MFRVLYTDNPWPEEANMIPPSPAASRGGARKHYPLMKLEDLKAFELPPLEKDAWCFMWCPARKKLEALEVMRAWKFHETGSEFLWVKLTESCEEPTLDTCFQPYGKAVFGQGYYSRIGHEYLLIGKRGRPGPPVFRNLRSVVYAPRGKHSAKPEIFASIIEAFSDGPYVELFARRRRPGWTSLGNQVEEGT